MARTRVFVSYGHEDTDWLNRFQQHIAVLERLDVVDLWAADTRISGGADWERKIDTALTNAKVAVLLISPAFLASKFGRVKRLGLKPIVAKARTRCLWSSARALGDLKGSCRNLWRDPVMAKRYRL